MKDINNKVIWSTIFVIAISAALTITIINNTIQLVIQARKEEIEIMRLMGVSNWYIKTPLIMQGAFYGFVAALISIMPLGLWDGFLQKLEKFVLVTPPDWTQIVVIWTLIIVAVVFGAVGSLLSIKKHLQV